MHKLLVGRTAYYRNHCCQSGKQHISVSDRLRILRELRPAYCVGYATLCYAREEKCCVLLCHAWGSFLWHRYICINKKPTEWSPLLKQMCICLPFCTNGYTLLQCAIGIITSRKKKPGAGKIVILFFHTFP